MPEFYRDLKLDSDKDIIVDGTNDLALTETQDENISQTVYLSVSAELGSLFGRPLTPQVVESMRSLIREALQADPQIDEVVAVDITEVNRAENSVTARVVMLEDDDFVVTVEA